MTLSCTSNIPLLALSSIDDNCLFVVSSFSGNLSDEVLIGNPGYYNRTINATLQPSEIPYTLIITLIKENYSFSTVFVTITVRPITTYIYRTQPVFEIFYNGLINISATYNFSDGRQILGANLSYYETTIGTGNLTEFGDGLYYFTINSSSLSIGTYLIIISCKDYGFTSTQAFLTVRAIKTEINYTAAISVETLADFDISIYVNDTDHNTPATGILVNYTLETITGNLNDQGNGIYNNTINANLQPRDVPYYLVLTFHKENYSFSEILIAITVKPISTYIYPTQSIFVIHYNGLINISVTYYTVKH